MKKSGYEIAPRLIICYNNPNFTNNFRRMKKIFFKLLLPPVFLLAGFFVFTSAASATDIIIDHDTVWGKGDVIVVNANKYLGELGVRIASKATLTINAGAIIKLSRDSLISVEGNLIIHGAPDDPVIITSIKDDSVGGDTNKDGNATLSARGDWGKIKIKKTGNAIIDYAIIQYGGADENGWFFSPSIIDIDDQYNSNLPSNLWPKTIISNSLITESAGYGIYDRGWRTVITKNKIVKNNSYGIRTYATFRNEITYNDINLNGFNGPISYWGGGIFMERNGIQPNISYNNFHNNTTGFKNNSGVNVSAINNWWGSDQGPIVCSSFCIKAGERDSVIGLVTYQPFLTEEWLPAPTGPDPVILIPGILGSWYDIFSGKLELDPIFNTYDNLWEAFKAAGYKEGETLFAFPYQWRNSNASSSIELKNKIDEVKDICKCGKVDIVAHSMGGLVARQYVENGNYENDIDQLIFLATPQRGASKAYLMWDGGEVGFKPLDEFRERIFKLEAEFSGYGSVYLYISKLPMKSVQELLPTYDYLRDKSTMALRVYPNNYPRNLFLEDLNNPIKLSKLNGLKITNIIADAGASSTINNFRVVENKGIDGEWEHGYPEHYAMPFTDHGLEYGLGDETVPDRSNKDFNGWPNIIINTNHDNIATDAQKVVIKELTGTEPANEIRNNIFKKFLMIRIFSPADFRITAPDGRLLGKDFATNQPINQIQGAFYSGFDNGIEFAVIPDPIEGDYKVDLMGTGNGEYKLSASYIDDNNSLDKEFIGNIEPNQPRTLDFVLAPNTNEPISDLITIDGIIKEIEAMYAKGWINNMGAKMSLINGLKLIDLKSGKSNSAVIEKLKMVLNKLEQIRKQGKVNQEGFQILKDDINNLKINL